MARRPGAACAATAVLLACALAACASGSPPDEDGTTDQQGESEAPTDPTPEADATGDNQADAGPGDPLADREEEPDDPAGEPGTAAPPPGEQPLPEGVAERPGWLGERPLPERADGHGEAQPTPPELVDRRLVTPEPPEGLEPPDDGTFHATVDAVPDEVAARSTWRAACPVGLEELRYVTVTFWGFDERPHTGEMLVHERAADDLVGVFERLHEARFPIEEMRVVAADELDAPPTGDGNNTTVFVCRDIAGGSQSWSQHAYGLAIDINPFHNPYERGDLVLPELAGAYLDRDDHRPGMIQPGDAVTEAFADIGWGWGGEWRTLVDWMHFSESGR